jgi:4-hydroxy-3-polyprenylbenzoate decarboxylase
MTRRLVVGISGASGAIYGVRLLEALRGVGDVETHLVITEPARRVITEETGRTPEAVAALADVSYPPSDVGAAIASGSFRTGGMAIAPCSVKSLSAVALSRADDLLSRAADVHLKEGQPLVLLLRETPLHLGHLRLMVRAAELGVVVMPAAPSFYGRPATIDDLIDGMVGRVLARLGIENDLYHHWQSESPESR